MVSEYRHYTTLLAVLVVVAVGCGGEPPPNIDATVEARAKELVAEQVNNLPPDPDRALDYYNRGLGYYDSREFQLAIGDYTKAIHLGLSTTHYSGRNPLADAYVNRGYAYGELGQYQRAIEDFNKAIQLDPDFAPAYYTFRGAAYGALGQYQRAIEDFGKAIQLNPDDAWAYSGRGFTYRHLGEDAKAEVDFDKACSLDSKYCKGGEAAK